MPERDIETLLQAAADSWPPDEAVAQALAALSTAALAPRLETESGLRQLAVAFALAQRNDPRGVAALARAATAPELSGRALACLSSLDMLDMVPPYLLELDALDQNRLEALLGGRPEKLEEVYRGGIFWPGQGPAAPATVYRYVLHGLPGIALLGPAETYLTGGVDELDLQDCLAVLCGRAHHDLLPAVSLEEVSREAITSLVKQRPYLHDRAARAELAYYAGFDLVLVVELHWSRGVRYLVGGSRGNLRAELLPSRGYSAPGFGALHAYWLWLGYTLRWGQLGPARDSSED